MPRKPPPTIYTCIAEPGEDDEVVIRWSCDPDALDSVGTMRKPPRDLVSKSRVAFLYTWDEPKTSWAVSCRGGRRQDDMVAYFIGEGCKTFAKSADDNGAAGARWLVEGEEE
jgi:hypothetical protein